MNRIILEKNFVILYRKDMDSSITLSYNCCKRGYALLDINCQRIRKFCTSCPLRNLLANYGISDEEVNICLRKKKLEKLLA